MHADRLARPNHFFRSVAKCSRKSVILLFINFNTIFPGKKRTERENFESSYVCYFIQYSCFMSNDIFLTRKHNLEWRNILHVLKSMRILTQVDAPILKRGRSSGGFQITRRAHVYQWTFMDFFVPSLTAGMNSFAQSTIRSVLLWCYPSVESLSNDSEPSACH